MENEIIIDESCACKLKRHREESELKGLQNRLSRIEGQVRGLSKMLSEDAYCMDIITQVSAVSSALNAFSRELMASHIRTCITEEIRLGGNEKTEEFIAVLGKLMK